MHVKNKGSGVEKCSIEHQRERERSLIISISCLELFWDYLQENSVEDHMGFVHAKPAFGNWHICVVVVYKFWHFAYYMDVDYYCTDNPASRLCVCCAEENREHAVAGRPGRHSWCNGNCVPGHCTSTVPFLPVRSLDTLPNVGSVVLLIKSC